MLRRSAVAILALAACPLEVQAQLVVSARSGLIHHVVGEVFVDGEAVAGIWGGLSYVSAGSTLETGNGQAELLLAPGIFLRLGPDSRIRMLADDITAVQLELQRGAAMVDWQSAIKQRAVTISSDKAAIRLDRKGLYRLQADLGSPLDLRVLRGRAAVVQEGAETVIRGRQEARLGTAGLAVHDASPCDNDEFDRWNLTRTSRIAEMNRAGRSSGDELLRGLRSLARALSPDAEDGARQQSASGRLRNGALRGKLR